jgi:MOSC domain-containing protein YiiM
MVTVRSFAELESAWQALDKSPRQQGRVSLIVLRHPDRSHQTPSAVEITPDGGLRGDRWSLAQSPDPGLQVTLMNVRVAELVSAGRWPLDAAGDNLLVDFDLSQEWLPTGARLAIGTACLEVTPHPHSGCKKFAAKFGQDALRWVNWKDFRPRRLRGLNCRVVTAGRVAVGDPVRRLDEA